MQRYAIFVGIDMSKRWFDASLYWPGFEGKQPHKQFDNAPHGFQAFVQWVSQSMKTHKLAGPSYVCMEHTGIYGLPLSLFLEKKQVQVVMECPLRIAKSLGLHRGKTDSADAQAIARYASKNYQDIEVRPVPGQLLLQVQFLLSLRSRLVRYRQGLEVAAREVSGFLAPSVVQLVDQYSTPVSVEMKQQIKHLDATIKRLLNSQEHMQQLYLLLSSIVGIGPVIAAYLLVYTNGFTAFRKGRQFACYIGVAPFRHRSGTSVHRPDQVSNLANKRIKTLLSTAAIVAIKHDPELRVYYKRQLERGKEEGWILNAVKNKLVQRVFATVQRGTPYVKRDTHLA